MPYMLVRIRLVDFDWWRAVFDEPEQIEIRTAYGCLGTRVFRSVDNPSEVVLLMEWGDIDGAKEYGISDELRLAMGRSGGSDRPSIHFLDEVG